jgi:hypothetical protein
MKKLFMLLMFVLAMAMASHHHTLAQEVTITLNPGWTWVSYPRADTMDVTTALQSIPPTEGDVIKSQTSFSMYTNGLWFGNLEQLIPGKGLMYKSMNPEIVTFVFGATPNPIPNTVPEGAINGLFTVNSFGEKVYFSQGNLQYQASTNTWRFAVNQWDYVGTQIPDQYGLVGGNVDGSDNSYISENYSGWIDLFGWGTSGYAHGAVCYQPWSVSQSVSDYYAYGVYNSNLYDQTGQADWGYNAISNGGNSINTWRALTQPEWDYVLNIRNTTSGIRYAKAQVNGVNGLVLLPDDWNASTYSLSNANAPNGEYGFNMITISQWGILENAGAIFLPAAGYRRGTSTFYVSDVGLYWSASHCRYGAVYSMVFGANSLVLDGNGRSDGFSVRLVCPANSN